MGGDFSSQIPKLQNGGQKLSINNSLTSTTRCQYCEGSFERLDWCFPAQNYYLAKRESINFDEDTELTHWYHLLWISRMGKTACTGVMSLLKTQEMCNNSSHLVWILWEDVLQRLILTTRVMWHVWAPLAWQQWLLDWMSDIPGDLLHEDRQLAQIPSS